MQTIYTSDSIPELRILTQEKIEAMDHPFTYVPPHTRGGIIRWIENGIPPGSFLEAVLENDLKQAFGNADEENSRHLRSIIAWFYNYAPTRCWGYTGAVKVWYSENMEDRHAE